MKIIRPLFCLTFFKIIFSSSVLFAQYPPAAGQLGSTAVHKDSSAIVSWANAVYEFKRGAADIATGWAVLASFGDSTAALGYAEGNSTGVVSLGDSGYVTLAFPFPIMNGIGNDFAVFENSFSDDYLEFAHVEVSSDGIKFIRIPSVSLIPVISQTATYATSNTEQVHNLAGKYKQGYGTPFDLEDIVDSTGINLDSVLYVRIVDVIGTINSAYCTFDSQGNRINDPYPTDFESGGFDLDGVAVINENNIYAQLQNTKDEIRFEIYPNPSNGIFRIKFLDASYSECVVFDASGKVFWTGLIRDEDLVDLSSELKAGLYFLKTSDINTPPIKLIVVN